MILVLGSVTVKSGQLAQALTLSQVHVKHSRAEHGCVWHSVNLDSENPDRLVFVEKWTNQDALLAHFESSTSVAFSKAIGELASIPPTIEVYAATQVNF